MDQIRSEDPVVALARHALSPAVGISDASSPPPVVAAAKMILLDSLGVGIAGSRASLAQAMRQAASSWGRGGGCRVLGEGDDYPAATAALLNAYQIHGQEFDCVHEPAVVHPMAATLAAGLAQLDSQKTAPDTTGVSGKAFLSSICAGIDVAITIGLSARSGLRFFRPATAGAFGAAAVVARLRGYTLDQTIETFGHLYSQLCGTMQAHTEGKAVLPVQIGFNARNAIVAADLAMAGVSAPREIIKGPYGYLELFEPGGDIDAVLSEIGTISRIAELSYKPFPTGRATHGGLDGLLSLRAEHKFTAADVESVELLGPPLIPRLVARPIYEGLPANYARLCMAYVGAVAIIRGAVELADFGPQSLVSTEIHQLAARISVTDDGNPDPNALSPQRVIVVLRDGRRLEHGLTQVFGSPARPMSEAQHLDKLRQCCDFAGFSSDRADRLIEQGLALDELSDVGQWLALAYEPAAN